MTEILHTIIGMPRSGKTTFLAALWYLLNESEINTALELDELVGDHLHLNSIVEAWMRCEEVPRTSIAAETSVAIHIIDRETGRRAVISFPDLSGESFERQVATRTCALEYVQGFEGSGGILLFVTADRVQDEMTILELAPLLDGDPSAEEPGDLQDWSPDIIPTQVRLVELLQFLQRPPFQRRNRRLGVIVSAWDVLEGARQSPSEWLEENMPLLYQFLMSNATSFKVQVFGVSAQGGELRDDTRQELLSQTPSERIVCIGPETAPHDLTAPVAWLMRDE